MKHVVMYSGGIASFLTAKLVIEKEGKENVILLFADTKIEDEDLYRFLNETSAALGVEITRIEDGRTPWEVFEAKRFIGNSRVDPCSEVLKRKLMDKWIEERFKPEDVALYFGIDWTEIHRYERLKLRKLPYQCFAPLCEPPYRAKTEAYTALKEMGIAPPRLYALGFSHNNCGGFCIKAGKSQFALLLKHFPERYKHHEEWELKMRKLVGPHTILSETVNGVEKGVTLKEWRERLEAGEEQMDLEWGGCGCAVDA